MDENEEEWDEMCKTLNIEFVPTVIIVDDHLDTAVLTNSHDGRNAFTLHAGLFRLVCSNGLVIADTTFEQVKIKHQWYSFDEIRKIMDGMLEVVPKVITQVQNLNSITLSDQQQIDFASKSLLTRYPTASLTVSALIGFKSTGGVNPS